MVSKRGILSVGMVVVFVLGGLAVRAWDAPRSRDVDWSKAPLDRNRAYDYLEAVCDFGPRPSGSEALEDLRKYVIDHWEKHGGEVELQEFPARHPLTGERVGMVNLIGRWNPESRNRIVIGAHYDTRPLPDLDPDPKEREEGVFIGANDGASGVALFMELAHHLSDWPVKSGVDLVLFDGEELIFREQGQEQGEYFLGSTYFARQYRSRRQPYRYRMGVVVDMIADADLEIYQEGYSVRLASQVVRDLWTTARELGIREFVPTVRHHVRDDHLPLNVIGNIPTCNLIDFDYPAWHTTRDTPEQCSGESLAKVGWVLLEWLKSK